MSFLKVKRKWAEDPKEIFILACKKTKLVDSIEESPVFEFTSTALQEKDINDVIKKTIDNHKNIKSRKFNLKKIREEMRADNLEYARKNKLKILNYIRKIDDSTNEESIPVIDLYDDSEKDENHNDYVYDIYYSKTCVNISDPNFTNDYCIHEVSNELYIQNESEDEVPPDDEDDSNDENNWRNDYPDEEDSGETSYDISDDEYLCHKMKKVHVGSDYSLSSNEYDQDVEDALNETNYGQRKNNHFDYYDEVASDITSDSN